MGKLYDEIVGHVNHAKKLMNEAEAHDNVNPQQANLALKKVIVELLQAFEKLCNEIQVDVR